VEEDLALVASPPYISTISLLSFRSPSILSLGLLNHGRSVDRGDHMASLWRESEIYRELVVGHGEGVIGSMQPRAGEMIFIFTY
jgi:hypothetical protein